MVEVSKCPSQKVNPIPYGGGVFFRPFFAIFGKKPKGGPLEFFQCFFSEFFSGFAISQPIFMVEVNKCPSQKVK